MRSVAVNLPSARPRTTSSRAMMSALTVAFGPMVTVEFGMVILPSTSPSTKRSSVPVTSPLILMPWLTQAGIFPELGIEEGAPDADFPGIVEVRGLDDCSGDACGFPSSLRHMGTPRVIYQIFRVACPRPNVRRDSES